MRNRRLKIIMFPCYRLFFFSLFFTGKQMLSGSQKKQYTMSRRSKTASASFLGTALGEAATASTDGSPKRSDPSKGTSASKEIQAQGVLKPKMPISNCTCSIKASSRVLLEEKVHRQNQLLKSKVQILLWFLGIWFQ